MTPGQMQQRIDEAINQAHMSDARDLKLPELSMRYLKEKMDAEVGATLAKSFKTYVEGLLSANQAGATIVMNPAVAPVAYAVAPGSRQQAAGSRQQATRSRPLVASILSCPVLANCHRQPPLTM